MAMKAVTNGEWLVARKTARQLWLAPLAVLCALLFASPARGQGPTYTIPQTVQATLANSVSCTGSAQTYAVENLGQTQHYISVTSAVNAPQTFSAEIQGVDNQGNTFTISDVLMNPSWSTNPRATVTAAGYFPKVQVVVTCAPVTATYTLAYSGTSATSNTIAGSYLLGQATKIALFQFPEGSSQSTNAFTPPYGSSAGLLNVISAPGSFPAGSSMTVACASASGSSFSPAQFTFSLTVSLVQQFVVPALPCPRFVVGYVSGGASANTITADMMFTQPGALPSMTAGNLSAALNLAPILTEKGARWTQFSAPAVSTQATASKAAGAAGVRHVADCVSYSAGAIAAPAATQLTINLRDGASGAGTVIWTKTVTIPASAVPHYDGNFCGLNLIGTAATAMTLEFSALLANEFESVTLTGYDVQ